MKNSQTTPAHDVLQAQSEQEPTYPWSGVISQEELDIYEAAGLGRKLQGSIRPALLVIDVQYRSIGRRNLPILESIKTEYPMSCGEYGWNAVPNIAELIRTFRHKNLPIIFPHVAFKQSHDGQRFADKAPIVMSIPKDGYEMVAECAPMPGDIMLPKHHPSAFFGTPLISYLTTKDVNCVFLAGATTSGCVRATAVDASSLGYHVIVPHDSVYDRSQTSHAVNLFDMNSKYADVMSTKDAIELLV